MIMTDKLTIKLDGKLYFLLIAALLLLTLIIFKDSITPASADYHEDSAQQVLVIELGDSTINKIAKILNETQKVELSDKSIEKLREIQEISLSQETILGLKEGQTLSLTEDTLDILKSNQTVSICDTTGEVCTEINSTGFKTSTYHRNSSN